MLTAPTAMNRRCESANERRFWAIKASVWAWARFTSWAERRLSLVARGSASELWRASPWADRWFLSRSVISPITASSRPVFERIVPSVAASSR